MHHTTNRLELIKIGPRKNNAHRESPLVWQHRRLQPTDLLKYRKEAKSYAAGDPERPSPPAHAHAFLERIVVQSSEADRERIVGLAPSTHRRPLQRIEVDAVVIHAPFDYSLRALSVRIDPHVEIIENRERTLLPKRKRAPVVVHSTNKYSSKTVQKTLCRATMLPTIVGSTG